MCTEGGNGAEKVADGERADCGLLYWTIGALLLCCDERFGTFSAGELNFCVGGGA